MNQEISVIYGNLSHFPPVLILHATDDANIFFQGSVLLQKKIQQAGGVAHGLYFSGGEHQFIKNEGISEIRCQALEGMNNFFQEPEKPIHNNLAELQYTDVVSEYELFLNDKDGYLNSKLQVIKEENLDDETKRCGY